MANRSVITILDDRMTNCRCANAGSSCDASSCGSKSSTGGSRRTKPGLKPLRQASTGPPSPRRLPRHRQPGLVAPAPPPDTPWARVRPGIAPGTSGTERRESAPQVPERSGRRNAARVCAREGTTAQNLHGCEHRRPERGTAHMSCPGRCHLSASAWVCCMRHRVEGSTTREPHLAACSVAAASGRSGAGQVHQALVLTSAVWHVAWPRPNSLPRTRATPPTTKPPD